MRFWAAIREDARMKIAVVLVLLMLCLFLFNLVSDIPKQNPIIGVFTFAMIPILFIAGAVNFVLIIVSSRERKKDN